MESLVVIIGAGPAGLATAACLFLLSIPFVILEREDCVASLWKRRAYDRLKLHLAKRFCSLPHMPFPATLPTFVPKDDFIRYLDDYAARFHANPTYNMNVESASFDAAAGKWDVVCRHTVTGDTCRYAGRFLVAATGENGEGFVPEIPGMSTFPGEVIHSSEYKSATRYAGKKVLVVGGGNSGMEIAYDLSCFGAHVSISIRSPIHVVTRGAVYMGMILLRYLPLYLVDVLVITLSKLKLGDMSKCGIRKPKHGPFFTKVTTGKSPVVDVGTVDKIRSGKIQVLSTILNVNGNEVEFSDGKLGHFDVIIFATGYRSMINSWIKGQSHFVGEDGLPKKRFPNHWKGGNDSYFVGLSRQGLHGVSVDAQNVAYDINKILRSNDKIHPFDTRKLH